MTLDLQPADNPTDQPDLERPADPRPAWERIAYTWLECEVDHGQPVDATALAAEVSVALGLAGDLVRVLRAERDRDPALAELRGRLVRDRIADAYLRRELAGPGRLDPAELAVEVGTTAAVARQWLAGLRAQHPTGQRLEVLTEPVSHGRPTPGQLTRLQAHFAAGGHQQATVTGRPADPERLAAEVERHYWTREIRGRERLQPGQLALELGGDQRSISRQLAQLRAGPATAGGRIAQLWQAYQNDPTRQPLRSSQLAWRLGVSDSSCAMSPGSSAPAPGSRHWPSGWPPPTGSWPAHHRLLLVMGSEIGGWMPPARRSTPSCSSPTPARSPKPPPPRPSAPAVRSGGHAWRRPCTAPRPRDDHSGIFAGTTASERVRLRGRSSMAQGTRFLQDRTAAEQALQLANQVSIDRATQKLGVSKQALRRAFDQHGLPQPQVFRGGPRRTRFYDDPAAAEQAWRRAAEVGINQTRKELGVSDRALRNAWQRHGLGLPPRPGGPAGPRPLDAAFVALNRRLLPARERSPQELAAWVRREEEYVTLGASVVVELNSESRTRPTARTWAIIRRGQRGQHRAAARQARGERRHANRTARADRTSQPQHADARTMATDAR